MKRATLYISGNVQRAGYRTKVVSIAKALDINVQNLPDERVKIIAEGEVQNLKHFIQAIKIKNTLINVKNIECKFSDPSGEYYSFYKLVDEGETDERLDTAADLLKELIHVTKNGFDRLEAKQDIMIEKQDLMIEKMDNNTLILKDFKDETNQHFDQISNLMTKHDNSGRDRIALIT
jgi:acylphosphatase